jgi:hypothetical protein
MYASYVSPSAYWFRAGGSAPYCNVTAPVLAQNATTNCFYPSNLFWVGSCFRQWRGSVRFRFTFSKTKYHGGRVMAAFIPYRMLVSSGPSDAYGLGVGPEALGGNTQPFGYSAVFDLRDGNVFEFDVSYINARPYTDFFSNIGTVTLSIIDPLQVTSVVSSTINFVVEVKALPDFEFATPIGPRYPPINCVNASAVRLQSGKMLPTISEESSQYCVGERINSLKQLIMLPKWSNPSVLASATTGALGLLPWYYTAPLSTAVPAPVAPFPRECLSWGGYLSKGYTYVRGSTDYHFYGTCYGPGTVTGWLQLCRDNFAAPPALYWTPSNGPSSCLPRVYSADLSKGLHCRVPFYARSARIRSDQLDALTWVPTWTDPNSAPSAPPNDESPITLPRFASSNGSSNSASYAFTRSAGDDAMMGQFIGPPFLALLSGGSGGIYDTDSSYWP